MSAEAPEEPLSGWKAIADYLASKGGPSTERMARYLLDDGLPVYHQRDRGRVLAMRSDIDRWWRDRLRLVRAKRISAPRRPLPVAIENDDEPRREAA